MSKKVTVTISIESDNYFRVETESKNYRLVTFGDSLADELPDIEKIYELLTKKKS